MSVSDTLQTGMSGEQPAKRSLIAAACLWAAVACATFLVVFWSFGPMLTAPPFEHHSILLWEHAVQHGWLDVLAVGNAAGLRLLPY